MNGLRLSVTWSGRRGFAAAIPVVVGGGWLLAMLLLPADCRALEPVFNPTCLEARVLEDAADGQLTDHSFWTAALVLSGVTEAEKLERYTERLADIEREIRVCVSPSTVPWDRGRAAFAFMHARLLTGPYDAACSELPGLLDEGRYNCVSATILYFELCRLANVPAVAVESPGHVYVRWNDAAQTAVQTTDPVWLDRRGSDGNSPVLRPPSHSDLGASDHRPLTPVQLLAKLYYNRGVTSLNDQRYTVARHFLEWAVRLDPVHRQAQANLITTFNNAALADLAARRFEDSAAWIREGLKRFPGAESLLRNDLCVHEQWAQELCRQGRYGQAVDVLEQRERARPDAIFFRATRIAISQKWDCDTDSPAASRAVTRITAGQQILRPPHLTQRGS